MAAPHWAAWLLLARPLSRPDPGGSSGARCCLPGLSLAHGCEADATSPVPAGAVTWPGGLSAPILQKETLRLRGMCLSEVTQQSWDSSPARLSSPRPCLPRPQAPAPKVHRGRPCSLTDQWRLRPEKADFESGQHLAKCIVRAPNWPVREPSAWQEFPLKGQVAYQVATTASRGALRARSNTREGPRSKWVLGGESQLPPGRVRARVTARNPAGGAGHGGEQRQPEARPGPGSALPSVTRVRTPQGAGGEQGGRVAFPPSENPQPARFPPSSVRLRLSACPPPPSGRPRRITAIRTQPKP